MQSFTPAEVSNNLTSTATMTTALVSDNSAMPLLHEYFRNSYYKNFIALGLILFFSIVFNLIYLIIDSLLDKQKHYNHAVKLTESYLKARQRRQDLEKSQENKDPEQNYELDKVKALTKIICCFGCRYNFRNNHQRKRTKSPIYRFFLMAFTASLAVITF